MKTVVDATKVLDQNRRFHDEVEADGYDQRMDIAHDADATSRMVAELERVLRCPLPGGRVLDVGSGTGHVAIKLARTGRFERVYAADISSAMLAKARASAAAHGCRIETVETDMVRLPFEDASLDLVVGCAVLHHLPDPAGFLAEVRRVLKPGAPCVFIGDPSKWGNRIVESLKLPLVLAARVAKKIARRPPSDWRFEHIDVHTFTLNDLDRMTDGFEDVVVVAEGFVESIVDGSVLSPVREVLGRVPGVQSAAGLVRSALRWADRAGLERAVPADWCGCLKFSARKPLPVVVPGSRPLRELLGSATRA